MERIFNDADMMGTNERKNNDFQGAFNQTCWKFGLDTQDRALRRRAHDALPGDYFETDKDDLTWEQLKERISDALERYRRI